MDIFQESSDREETDKDLETREKESLERAAKARAEGNSWRLRQLRKMSKNPNDWILPKKDTL